MNNKDVFRILRSSPKYKMHPDQKKRMLHELKKGGNPDMITRKKSVWKTPLLSAAVMLLFSGVVLLFGYLIVQEDAYTAMDVPINLDPDSSITEAGTSLIYSLEGQDAAYYEIYQIEALLDGSIDLASFEKIHETADEEHRYLMFHAVDEEDRYFVGGAISRGDAIIGMSVSQVTENNMQSLNDEEIFTLWIEDQHYQHTRMVLAWTPEFTVNDFLIQDPFEIDHFESDTHWMMGHQSYASTEEQIEEFPWDDLADRSYLEGEVCYDDECANVSFPRNPY